MANDGDKKTVRFVQNETVEQERGSERTVVYIFCVNSNSIIEIVVLCVCA